MMISDRELNARAQFVPMAELGQLLPGLCEQLSGDHDGVIAITRDGKPVMALISWESWLDTEDLAAGMETLEILMDPKAREALLRNGSAPDAADTIPGDVVIQKLVDEGLLDPAEL